MPQNKLDINATLTHCRHGQALVVLDSEPFNGWELRPHELKILAHRLIALAEMANRLPTGGKHYRPTKVDVGAVGRFKELVRSHDREDQDQKKTHVRKNQWIPPEDRMNPEDIKAAIKKAGYSQALIAEEFEVASSSVFNVIYGSTKSMRIAKRIAEIVGKPISDIWPGLYAMQEVA